MSAAVPATVAEVISSEPEVVDAVAQRVLNTEGIVTGASGEELPDLPTGATVTELAFTDEVGDLAFVIDGVGTDSPRVRDAAILYPSGDTTGATDRLAINAALLTYDRVMLMPGEWYQNAAIVLPSNTHLHVEGPFVSRLVNGSNSNLLTNVIGTTTCTNVAITGRGPVVFDGNGSNQTRMDTAGNGYAGWKNVGALFVNVDGLIVRDITLKRTTMFGALTTGVRNGLFQNVTIDQDHLSANQDGIDIGPGCSYIWVQGTRVTTEDDVHSIFAKYSTSQNTIHPLYRKGSAAGMGGVDGALYSAAGNDTHHIYIDNSHVDAGKNFLRLQAAEGSKLYEIHATNLRHTSPDVCRALVIFGEMLSAYIDAPPASDGSDFNSITIDGFSGPVLSLVYLDSHVRNVTIRNAFLPLWGTLLTQRDLTDPAPSARSLVIEGVTSPQGSVVGNNNLLTLSGGAAVIDCSLTASGSRPSTASSRTRRAPSPGWSSRPSSVRSSAARSSRPPRSRRPPRSSTSPHAPP